MYYNFKREREKTGRRLLQLETMAFQIKVAHKQ